MDSPFDVYLFAPPSIAKPNGMASITDAGRHPAGIPVIVNSVDAPVPVIWGRVRNTILPILVAFAVPVGVVVMPAETVTVKEVSP